MTDIQVQPVHVEFLADEVTLEQVLPKVLQFLLSVSFWQSLSSILCHPISVTAYLNNTLYSPATFGEYLVKF